jgi:hypothetical protein
MSAAFHGCFTPWLLKLMRTKELERSSDQDVEQRAAWAPEKVLSEYERWSGRYLKLQPIVRNAGLSGLKIPLGELGTYPLGIFPAAFTFDHHTHLRHDVAEAIGRTPPPTDSERLAVVLEWMTYGIPQMCRHTMAVVDRPLDLTLNGDGQAAQTWGLSPSPSGLLELHPGGSPGAEAHITGQDREFVLWGTQRKPWREHDVKIDGDVELGTRFLDALNVV